MKKHFISQFISAIISFAIVVQILPMNAMASAIENMNINTNQMVTSVSEEIPNIVAEIAEERDQFSKVYLLEDGSYYGITTENPIHKQVNGEWENISGDLNEVVWQDIADAESLLQQVAIENTSNSTYSVSSTASNEIGTSSITKNSKCCKTYPSSRYGFFANSRLLLKPNNIDNYLSENKVVLEANIIVTCSVVANGGKLYIEEISEQWNSSTSDTMVGSYEGEAVDCVDITEAGTYYIDVTELWGRWENGDTEINGVMLCTKEESAEESSEDIIFTVQISGISVRYKTIDEMDTEYTYHTVDMDKAGVLQVNDFTNTIRFEQEILGKGATDLPIEIKRFYNSVNTDLYRSAGMSSIWNYDSTISYNNEIVTWKLFDGSTRHFKRPSTTDLITNGEYEKWIEYGTYIGDASLWLKTSDDYSSMYIELDGSTYNFNSDGKLTSIETITNNQININYDSLSKITEISYNNYIFEFIYNDNETTGGEHIETVKLKKDGNEIDRVDFLTNYDENTEITSHATTYRDSTVVVYEYDFGGKLLAVVLNNSIRWELSYRSCREALAEDCSRFESCKKYQLIDGAKQENDAGENVLTIDSSKTYQREFSADNSAKEVLYFDRDINIVSHEMADGRYLFASYDDNGYLNSYVVSKSKDNTNFLTNPGFESGFEDNLSWNIIQANSTITRVNAVVDEDSEIGPGNKVLEINSTDYISGASLEQKCSGQFASDQTYVFGAWVKLNDDTVSSERNGFKINIYRADAEGNCDKDSGLITSISFDTCAKNEWHYKLAAFKLEEAQSTLYFVIEYDGPGATIKIDNATFYKAEISQADIPGVTTSTAGTITRNEDGSISSEILTDNIVSMIKSYEYDEDNVNKLTSITDYNGITTYYNYNSENELVEMGTNKSNGVIVNSTRFSYIGDLNKTIQQTVTDISTGNTVDIVAKYSYADNQIESVTHNGVSYNFKYEDGNLVYVYTSTQEESGSEIQNKIIDYGYKGSNIGEIKYINGLTIRYEYSNNMVTKIQYELDEVGDNSNSSTVKTLNYTYDNEGLLNVTDSQTGFRIVYTDIGYRLYRTESGAEKLLYVLENNADGSTTETYCPDTYKANNEHLSVITTGETTLDFNSITKSTTRSSDVSFKKITNWTDESDYESVIYNYHRQGTTDYFGRVTQKSIEMQTLNQNEKKSKVTELYSYKELENGVTSALVSSHSTTITEDDNPVPFYSDNLFYEYDNSGNIVSVYTMVDENRNELLNYVYDEAGQIVKEINYETGISALYTYDAGGNITTKRTYNISENEEELKSSDYFVYNGNRLIKYNNESISYDSLGNPLNYSGARFNVTSIGDNAVGQNNTIEGELEWLGNKLSSFESEENRYEYEYDENGYRIRKLTYEKTLTESNQYEYSLTSEIIYIWDNGVLKSMVIDNTETEPWQSDILYDQEGGISGFISYTGIPIYFVKDLNGSVKRLIYNEGTTFAEIDYDAWGAPLITIPVDTSTDASKVTYAFLAAVTVINPIAYNGYFYDYETGLYFCKDKVYSPSWGRYLNMNEVSSLLEPTNSAVSANLYAFCNNNPVNIIEPYSAWANNQLGFEWNVNGFEVKMCEAFLSRPFCMIFANQFLKTNGTWSYSEGHNYFGMNALEIAATLFAKCVGKNAMFAVNKVNACWGDGWIFNNKKSDTIAVKVEDDNYWKYEKIWYAASDIKMYAWSQGIYITI